MSESKDFRNSNGLINGRIPAGDPCPFINECHGFVDNCPTLSNKKENSFSCGFARAWSILEEGKSEKNN